MSFVPQSPSEQVQESEASDSTPVVHQGIVPLFSDADFPPLQSAPQSTLASSNRESSALSPGSSPASDHAPSPSPVPQAPPPAPQRHQMITRSQVGTVKPNPRYVLLTQKVSIPEPRTIADALKHEGWRNAMGDEYESCKETNTFTLVPRTEDMHVLGNRWVHRVKLNADVSFKKLRSRLVAKGNEQEEGVDYLETYSPVVRMASVRTILHMATVLNWEIRQMDVKNAFLHGDLQEEVFMKQPAGFVDSEHPHYVWRLNKAIYGLKQAPRAWFDKFSSFLIAFGFCCS